MSTNSFAAEAAKPEPKTASGVPMTIHSIPIYKRSRSGPIDNDVPAQLVAAGFTAACTERRVLRSLKQGQKLPKPRAAPFVLYIARARI